MTPNIHLTMTLLVVCGSANAWRTQDDQASPEASVQHIAALVGDDKILISEVQWHYQKRLGERSLPAETENLMRAQVLRQLVRQQLVIQYLQQTEQAATADEIRLAVEQIEKRADSVGKSLADFLREQSQTRQGFEHNLNWQISWGRYTNRHLTDDNLARFFEERRRQFDGTQLHVAHLLIKVDSEASEDDWKVALEKAQGLYQDLTNSKLSWDQAVHDHSMAPTKERAGDLGWIKLSGPMPKTFTDAAFQLETGQFSPPVRTDFGVHIIKCLEDRPGGVGWYDVETEVRKGAVRFLFDRIVDEQKDKVEVRYTGNSPYIDPKTGELKTPTSK